MTDVGSASNKTHPLKISSLDLTRQGRILEKGVEAITMEPRRGLKSVGKVTEV